VTIEHESGKYSHMVVCWDGKVYDATVKPPVYGISENKYFDEIKKYGFNGLRFKVPFVANNKN
jgi:acetate kinase